MFSTYSVLSTVISTFIYIIQLLKSMVPFTDRYSYYLYQMRIPVPKSSSDVLFQWWGYEKVCKLSESSAIVYLLFPLPELCPTCCPSRSTLYLPFSLPPRAGKVVTLLKCISRYPCAWLPDWSASGRCTEGEHKAKGENDD